MKNVNKVEKSFVANNLFTSCIQTMILQLFCADTDKSENKIIVLSLSFQSEAIRIERKY